MNNIEQIAVSQAPSLREAVVLRAEGDGTVVVRGTTEQDEVLCERLCTSDVAEIQLAPRDRVLVWLPTPRECKGIVIGRVGLSHARETPDTLLLEAKHTLTLRVGDGSITIREDGKILIKGKDLVSHAQRMNRIKGGSVSIN